MVETAAEHVCDLCRDAPPAECPQCDTVILGATKEDWRKHYREDCTPLGELYCFASEWGDSGEST